MVYKVFTSESVCAGHPDKICDQISDAVVDYCLKRDPQSRVAVETLVTTNRIILAGEVTSKAKVNYEKIARNVVKSLDYNLPIYNFDWRNCRVDVYIHSQSADIAKGVTIGGAGDQGMMFGYATTETEHLMPLPIMIAHEIAKNIDQIRKTKVLDYLRPDGKSQVTVEYKNGFPTRVVKAVTAVAHNPRAKSSKVSRDIYETAIVPSLKRFGFKVAYKDTICNGTGKWSVGGPASDTGVTGRKIIVDSYGASARVGGGCFSGKDPTKVDRSGAYAARFIAKNIVAKKLARKCEVKLAFVIGGTHPLAKAIDTFGTEKVSITKIEKFAWNLINLSVKGIIKDLDLKRPVYQSTAAYGHFGREEFSWERIVNR